MEMIRQYLQMEKQEKIKRYKILNQYAKKGQIVFTGSSLMEQFPIYEFMQHYKLEKAIYNRGIGGFTTEEMLQELDTMVFDLEPSKIFLNIGTNDLNTEEYKKEDLINRYEEILLKITTRLPDAKIYLMAYYPVNGAYDFGSEFSKELLKVRTNTRIREANRAVESLAKKLNLRYIDVNQNLYDENGNLKQEFSVEGIHMYGNGYWAILEDLWNYIEE
jgi:lysophospholipase L1-like esterase